MAALRHCSNGPTGLSPIVIMGRTQNYAWTPTAGGSDNVDYQLNESHSEIYQGTHVAPSKDFMLSDDPTSIPITRWALRKGKPYLYMISNFIGEAKEA
jgi:hypothetical protein